MSITGWAGFLSHYLQNTNSSLFASSLLAAHDDEIVKTAVTDIDLPSTTIPTCWLRVELLLQAPFVARESLVERLLLHASILRDAIEAAKGPRYTSKHLRAKLEGALADRYAVPQRNVFPRLWPKVADGIATLAVQQLNQGADTSRVHSLLTLAGLVQLFNESRPSVAAKRVNQLASRSMLGLRGAGTRIPSEVRAATIVDPVNVSRVGPARAIRSHSRLLLEVDNELLRVAHNESPLVALLDAHAPIPVENRRYAVVMPAIRRAVYRQYDCLTALLLTYSGIEHLVRSRLTRMGVPHWRTDGRPISARRLFDRLSLSQQYRDALDAVYDPEGLNTRNRLFHAGYMMVEQCRPRIVDAIQSSGAYDPDDHSPEVALRHAAWLLGELTSLWSFNDLDFSWIPDEAIDRDFSDLLLDLASELNTADGLERNRQLALYMNAVAPTFSTLSKLATVRTLRSPTVGLLAGLFAFFEGLLRNTMALMGLPTFRVTPQHDGLTAYSLMMDEDGLLLSSSVARLVEGLPDGQRSIATRCLRGVMNVRNRFAHGRVLGIPSEQMRGIGAVIFKLCSLMAAAGIEHMVREGAYFLWRNGSVDTERNWLESEQAVLRDLRHRAAHLPHLGDD